VIALLRRPLFWATLLAALGITVAALWIFPSGSYLLLPDRAHPVAALVKVPRAKPDRNGGGIYFVDVLIRRAKLFEDLFPGIHSRASLVPASAINPPGANDAARQAADLREMHRSQSIAAAVALNAVGYRVRVRATGVLVSQVDASLPAAGKLQPTDVILRVDSRRVLTPQQLRRAMSRHRPGETVRFGFRRGRDLRAVVVRTVADPHDPRRPIVGILVEQAADIVLPIKVSIDAGDVGGPSAGLAFALEVAQKLGRDVDRGYRVAATGQLGLDGSVNPIGGVKQKTFGVREAHVDVFVVPAGENAAIARKDSGSVRVIAVQTFPQALHALANLPPKP
jgi:Lon-like protease